MSWTDFFKKIVQIIIEILKPNPNTTTTTTTSVGPSNDEAAHGLDWTKVKFVYGDWSCPNAKPTLKMKEAKMNGGTAHLVWDDPRGKWAGNNNPPAPDGCCAGCFMVIKQSDGSWIGGRFDDISFGSPIGNGLVVDDRPLQHIWDQENVPDYPRRWRCPANGSEVAFVLVSFDGSVQQFGKERTTAGFTIWNK